MTTVHATEHQERRTSVAASILGEPRGSPIENADEETPQNQEVHVLDSTHWVCRAR